MAKAQDAVVEAVREKLLQRSEFGLIKYGAPIHTNPADHRAKLNHALEEALDLANYLQWCIMELDGSPELKPNNERGIGALTNEA